MNVCMLHTCCHFLPLFFSFISRNISPNNGHYFYSRVFSRLLPPIFYYNHGIKTQIVMRKVYYSFDIIKVHDSVCKLLTIVILSSHQIYVGRLGEVAICGQTEITQWIES